MTRLDIPVTYNFRPVAGTRAGTLFRSDALAKLSTEGRAGLRQLGVRRVVDLRSGLDRRLGGRDRLRGSGAELVRAPVFSGAKTSDVYTLTLDRIYREMITHHGDALGVAIRAIADAPEGAVVVHCTAGKDRSGVSAALIQLAIGVDEQTVLDDYALTRANLEGEWVAGMQRKMRRFRIDLTPQLEEVLVGSPPDAMAAVIEHVRDRPGGFDAFLAGIGVTDAHRERLAARFSA